MKYRVAVTQIVEVELDESKFDQAFMEEFRAAFYPFDTIDEHVCHIAQLEARGLNDGHFIEGYGHTADMGIMANVIDGPMAEVKS